MTSPTHDARLNMSMSSQFWATASAKHDVIAQPHESSLLNLGCNVLWCSALNHRKDQSLDWFAMLHSDVIPAENWLDTLIDEADEHGADFISALVPIKDGRGLYSTGMGDPADPFRIFSRITTRQAAHPDFPTTFDAERLRVVLEALPEPLRVIPPFDAPLLINTGCCAVRLDREWVEHVYFESFDHIRLEGGIWKPYVVPEDWVFSRKIAAEGGRVFATRAVPTIHMGSARYRSDEVWGWDRDREGPSVR